MTHRELPEVGARLEETAKRISGDAADPTDLYEAHESVAIQILDSEYMNYPPGSLEAYLLEYLEDLRRKLDLD